MSEQRDFLIGSAARLFEANADASALAQAQGYQNSLWAAIDALGIPQLLIPESHGGMGADWDDACGVLEASGYWQIPLPLAETMLGRRLAALAGARSLDEPISIHPDPVTTLRTSSGWQVTALLRAVPWARDVSTVLATAREPEGACLIVLSRSDAELRQSENLASEPRDDLQFRSAPAQVMPLPMPDATDLLPHLALLRTAQISGALQSILHRTVAYANERKQFGKALGQFQSIQQQLAVFGAEVAAVSCAVRSAARATDAGDARFQIAAAKLRANQAIGVAASTAHQVHGAIGFTQEYFLRHATQRLWSWRSEYGNDRFWSLQLGHSAIASGAEAFWAELTARDDATSLRQAAS